jgi:hypothetical protein
MKYIINYRCQTEYMNVAIEVCNFDISQNSLKLNNLMEKLSTLTISQNFEFADPLTAHRTPIDFSFWTSTGCSILCGNEILVSGPL